VPEESKTRWSGTYKAERGVRPSSRCGDGSLPRHGEPSFAVGGGAHPLADLVVGGDVLYVVGQAQPYELEQLKSLVGIEPPTPRDIPDTLGIGLDERVPPLLVT
jgi:hypothetical protein